MNTADFATVPDVTDRMRLRDAIRQGWRLPELASRLNTTVPTLEAIISGANATPDLRAAIDRVLAPAAPAPAARPPAPAPALARNIPRKPFNARALKCTMVLNAAELVEPTGSGPRINLQISVGGKVYTADIAAKSIRKARTTIAEHGDEVVLVLQGKLTADNTIVEAGLVAQLRAPNKAVAAPGAGS